MSNVLALVYEYQQLIAKRDRLSIPLDEEETARLLGLDQWLSGQGGEGSRRMNRLPFDASVAFTVPSGFEDGEVKNLSGRGIAIATMRPVAKGSSVLVRLADPQDNAEYFFPCRVAWTRHGALSGMGLIFDGVPHRSTMSGDDTGVWRRSLTMGKRDVSAA